MNWILPCKHYCCYVVHRLQKQKQKQKTVKNRKDQASSLYKAEWHLIFKSNQMVREQVILLMTKKFISRILHLPA